jgi:hypothetical protein
MIVPLGFRERKFLQIEEANGQLERSAGIAPDLKQ